MLLWLSDGARARRHIDPACLRSHSRERLSHDYLYHSVLGLANVRTALYRPELDLIRPCRSS